MQPLTSPPCRAWHIACAATLAALAPVASAQLLCTMPNGVIIKRNIGDCPADATLVRKASGEVVRSAPPKKPQPIAQPAAAPIAQRPPEQPKATAPQRSAYDVAQLACQALRQTGATECTIDSNVFSTSQVNATLATAPHYAATICKDVAATMRQASPEFATRAWGVRIYSPFSGERPIAACPV